MPVLVSIPLIHMTHHRLRLMNRGHRALFDRLQIRVRNYRGNLNDRIALRIKTGHFQINPY